MLTRRKCSQEGCSGRVEVSKSGIVKEIFAVSEDGRINFDEIDTQIVPMPQDVRARCTKCKVSYRVDLKGQKVGEALWKRR